jgi:DnaJ-class molecular chaperone
VTLDETYNGAQQMIQHSKEVICSRCNGIGGKEVRWKNSLATASIEFSHYNRDQ